METRQCSMGKKRKRIVPEKTLRPEIIAARAAGKVVTAKRSDAIARVLDTAIWLWFHNEDPLSVHLLVSAAYQCLEDMGKESGKGPLIKKHVGKRFTVAYDFLRHASSNPNVVLDFPFARNSDMLFDAIGAYDRIFRARSIIMLACEAYLVAVELKIRDETRRSEASLFLPKGLSLDEARSFSRPGFFYKACEMFAAQYPGTEGA